jgi:hypothetical protein
MATNRFFNQISQAIDFVANDAIKRRDMLRNEERYWERLKEEREWRRQQNQEKARTESRNKNLEFLQGVSTNPQLNYTDNQVNHANHLIKRFNDDPSFDMGSRASFQIQGLTAPESLKRRGVNELTRKEAIDYQKSLNRRSGRGFSATDALSVFVKNIDHNIKDAENSLLKKKTKWVKVYDEEKGRHEDKLLTADPNNPEDKMMIKQYIEEQRDAKMIATRRGNYSDREFQLGNEGYFEWLQKKHPRYFNKIINGNIKVPKDAPIMTSRSSGKTINKPKAETQPAPVDTVDFQKNYIQSMKELKTLLEDIQNDR